MLEFFTRYSINDIIIFIILLAIAIKAINDFIDWGKEKYEKKFNKDHQALNKQTAQQLELEKYSAMCQKQNEESKIYYQNLENKIDTFIDTVKTKVNNIEAQLARLTESDKHDIKGWIVEKHHYLLKKGWVDDFTMDTLERRYSDYVAEDGNSYIAGLMSELRALPHFPPEEE